MFIARVYPLMTVYTVKGGQRKGSKHVVSFPQNVSRIANTLPQLPSDIPIVVRRTNAEGMRHYDFRVRQPNVRAALTWLKENNKWYHDIVISEDRLSQLDEDGNIEDRFHSVSQGEPERMDDEGPREEETAANVDGNVMGMTLNTPLLMIEHTENPLIEIHTGAPEIQRPSRSEDEEIELLLQEYIGNRDDDSARQDVDNNNDDSDGDFPDEEFNRLVQELVDDDANLGAAAAEPIRWPIQEENPINEYTTEGYIAMAFPTLFPYGHADFRDHSQRDTSIKVAECFDALLKVQGWPFRNASSVISTEISMLI